VQHPRSITGAGEGASAGARPVEAVRARAARVDTWQRRAEERIENPHQKLNRGAHVQGAEQWSADRVGQPWASRGVGERATT
jgi:hypothetical protein